ncbi:MAG: nucleotidyltransferase [Candidatus Omnitrophica bacterium]|nr:nucleotidyltransferase [Candidatus Omnitrophota bacterium]
MTEKVSFSDYFRASIDLVERSKVDYLIIGGVAVGVWGKPRLTEDLDLMIFIQRKNLKIVFENAKKLGFKFNEKKIIAQAKLVGVFKIFYKHFHLDFLIPSLEFEKDALKRKQKVKIFEREVFVPSKEDLLLLKIIPGRPKDIVDAEGIVDRHKNKLDIKYLETWAQKLSDEAQDLRIYNELKRLLSLK